jgi:hypothetical protein
VQAQPRGDGLDREQFAAVSLGQPSVALLKRGLTLTHRDHEELHVYLIEECWRLSLKYDAERGEFTTWIGRARGRSITDWQRKHYGRTKWVVRIACTSAHGRSSSHSTPAIPISKGYSPTEIASGLGTSTRWVLKRLDELRAELERLG